MLESVRRDIGYALRWLARSPGFTAVAVASLAMGIGFNTALFSIVDALLLRPLPVERPDRLVDVYTRGSDGDTYATSSYPDYLDFRDRNAVFTATAGYSPALAAVKSGDQSRMALGEVVTGNYFQVLGVGAAIGRTLLPSDDEAGAPRVVMILVCGVDARLRARSGRARAHAARPRPALYHRRRRPGVVHRADSHAPAGTLAPGGLGHGD